MQADRGPSSQLQSDDGEVGLGIDHMTTDPALAAWTSQLLPQHAEVAVAQMPWLPTHKMHLTMEYVASTSFVRGMKALQDQDLLVAKVFDDNSIEGLYHKFDG